MTKKWKYNNLKVKEGHRGVEIFHPEANCVVGKVFSGSAEILSDITAQAVESSDEVNDILENL